MLHRARLARLRFAFCLWMAAFSGCHAGNDTKEPSAGLLERRVMLLGDTSGPAFFAGPGADAPAIGFGARDAKLILRGPAELGRVPVRVHGRLSLEAYVPEELLDLRVQRAERVQGSPVFVGPNDHVHVLGPAEEHGLVRVEVRPRIGDARIGPFTGKLALEHLAASDAPADAPVPQAGILYGVPAQTALPLYDTPHDGELIALVPGQPAAGVVHVFAVEPGWLGVRVGNGPYLVGYTNVALTLQGKSGKMPPRAASASNAGGVPRRIAETEGTLKRVANGAELRFRGRSIAKFRSEGWARVLGEARDGMVEVLAAADDQITVRALVDARQLADVSPDVTASLPAATLGAPELAPAQD